MGGHRAAGLSAAPCLLVFVSPPSPVPRPPPTDDSQTTASSPSAGGGCEVLTRVLTRGEGREDIIPTSWSSSLRRGKPGLPTGHAGEQSRTQKGQSSCHIPGKAERTGAELPGTQTGMHCGARSSDGSDSSGQGWRHRRGQGHAPNKERAFARSTCVAWKRRDIGRTGRGYRLALCLVLSQRGRYCSSTGRQTDKVSVRVLTVMAASGHTCSRSGLFRAALECF